VLPNARGPIVLESKTTSSWGGRALMEDAGEEAVTARLAPGRSDAFPSSCGNTSVVAAVTSLE